MELQRLLLNLGRPGESVRRLYAGTFHTPVWSPGMGRTSGCRPWCKECLTAIAETDGEQNMPGLTDSELDGRGGTNRRPPVEMLARMYTVYVGAHMNTSGRASY